MNNLMSINTMQLNELLDKYECLGVDLTCREIRDYIVLGRIIVEPRKQNQGLGTQFMNELCKYADRTCQTIFLTPGWIKSDSHRLRLFYLRFGFILNKGKDLDPRNDNSMLRQSNIKH